MTEIYQPVEDSYFFYEFLEEYFSKNTPQTPRGAPSGVKIKYLDMGTGSALLSEAVSKFLSKKDILVADINPTAVEFAKKKGFNAIKTNLFEKINDKFDLITFNAPYLPEDIRESKSSQLATTGGKRGDEISLKFLEQAKKHLNKNGKVFLLISSLTPQDKISKFKYKIVARKKIFIEELLILEFF